jgi:hypothetical protein
MLVDLDHHGTPQKYLPEAIEICGVGKWTEWTTWTMWTIGPQQSKVARAKRNRLAFERPRLIRPIAERHFSFDRRHTLF